MAALHILHPKAVENAKHPGKGASHYRIYDGGGLYLQITKNNTRSWCFRYTRFAKSHLLGLGPYDPDDKKGASISLKMARELAAAARAVLVAGRDPAEEKQTQKREAWAAHGRAANETFKAVAEAWILAHKPEWSNPHHAWQVESNFKKHAYPVIGDIHVAKIDTADVRRVLDPIWSTIPVTAERLRGRIESVLNHARAAGMRNGDNPARWRGHLDQLLASPRKASGTRGHHPALPWNQAPDFMAELVKAKGSAALALRFLMLTAARTGEVIGARWNEIDLDAAVWTVPASRMKAGREHRVPLSNPALEILRTVLPLKTSPDSPVFQSGAKGNGTAPMSNMAMIKTLKRLNPPDEAGAFKWADARTGAAISPHGLRSTFRDWCGEATDFPSTVAEAALAHVLKDKTEAAYARGDLLAKRVELMKAWAAYVVPKKPLS